MKTFKDIKQGAVTHWIKPVKDKHGNTIIYNGNDSDYKKIVTCQYCKRTGKPTCFMKIWTRIDNWSSAEKSVNINPERDYCSRFEHNEE